MKTSRICPDDSGGRLSGRFHLFHPGRRILQRSDRKLCPAGYGAGKRQLVSCVILPDSHLCLLPGRFHLEAAASQIKRFNLLRWDTLLILIEIFVVIFLGFLPESAPVQITQVLINLICSMQYNTFRQAQGIPMATTFCTNHIRQVGIAICKAIRHRRENSQYIRRMLIHLGMIAALWQAESFPPFCAILCWDGLSGSL